MDLTYSAEDEAFRRDVRNRLAQARTGLEAMRLHALRTLSGDGSTGAMQTSATKLLRANWHPPHSRP